MSTTTPRGHGLVAPVVVAPVIRTAATAIVFQGLIAGVASTIAVQGDDGSIIASQATVLGTDNIIINAAIVWVNALGGGDVFVDESGYLLVATVNVLASILLKGSGWATIFNYNAGGNCITFTGDNAKLRDLKIVITAGAGAGGSRPNGIFADTRTNLEVSGVWFVGDLTEVDDGSDLRQCGLVLINVTESQIQYNRFEDGERHGIYLIGATDNILVSNTCNENLWFGIYIRLNSDNSTLTSNTCNGNTVAGLKLDGADNSTLTSNTCNGNTRDGINLEDADNNTLTSNTCNGNTENGLYLINSDDNTITGNTCNGNTRNGVYLDQSKDNTVTGNTCNGNTWNGVQLQGGHYNNTFTGNTCEENTRNGILLGGFSSNNTVVGNSCFRNDALNSGTYSGINITGTSLDNLIHSNTCNENDKYGIDINADTCERNWVKNNQLRGNTAGAFNDLGTGTKTAEINILAPNPGAFIGSFAVEQMLDTVDTIVRFVVSLPREFQELVTAQVLIVSAASGNLRRAVTTNWGQFDSLEAYNTGSDTIAAGQVAVLIDDMTAIDIAAAFTGITSEDWIGVDFTREASNALDTINEVVYFIGFRMRYV